MKDLIGSLVGILLVAPVIVVGACVTILILSISLEAVTGFDLIRQVIRPFFGH